MPAIWEQEVELQGGASAELHGFPNWLAESQFYGVVNCTS